MASKNSPVRYGLSRVHYALYDEDTKTYGTPKPLAGAVSLSFENEGSQSNFYADNVIFFTSNPSASDTGSLELANMTEDAQMDLLGYRRADNGMLYEPTTVNYPTFAMLYQVEGNGNVLRGVRYSVKLSRPSEAMNTTSDSVEPDTQTFEYTATGRDFVVDGDTVNVIKGSVTDYDDTKDLFDAWFDAVVTPGDVAEDLSTKARLSALSIGSVTLSPAFDAGTLTYTASTTNATNAVTATAADGATATITVNGTAIESGGSATWKSGQNIVSVVVSEDGTTNAYTVIVTKS